jgi:hypothetical protein
MKTAPLKDNYRLANCCNPRPGDAIVGFLKFDSPIISVHKKDCINLAKVENDRLVALTWDEIINTEIETPVSEDTDYKSLDELDFKILAHHQKLGPDYAAVVAKATQIPRGDVFEKHKKLRDLDLLARVQPVMMQYRKGIVKGKWIKHRNHTYYELTSRGLEFINHYMNNSGEDKSL